MNRVIPLGFILLSTQAFALDSFSVMRTLGNKGDQGKETLLLICVKDYSNPDLSLIEVDLQARLRK